MNTLRPLLSSRFPLFSRSPRLRALLLAPVLGLTLALSGCYVAPVRPVGVVVQPEIAVRPAPARCWHEGHWGPWGWHPGHWGWRG